MRNPVRLALPWVFVAGLGLSGCDMLGIESASSVAARKEAEGRAVGGACRHAGRALEDCYALNRKADKPAVFAGWREMNDYMRENKIDSVPSQVGAGTPKVGEAAARKDEAADARPAEGSGATTPR